MLNFLNPLLSLGSRKVLDANDVGVPSKQDVAEEAYKNTNEAWDRELTKTAVINERRHRVNKKLRDPRIVSALLSSFGQTKFIAAFVYYLLAALLNFVPVFILNLVGTLGRAQRELTSVASIGPD
jgi:hypothetical protein